ncbi:hypothetical protein ES705_41190 [subsurface metagenome]
MTLLWKIGSAIILDLDRELKVGNSAMHSLKAEGIISFQYSSLIEMYKQIECM